MDLLKEKIDVRKDLIAVRDKKAHQMSRRNNNDMDYWILTFDAVGSKSDFSRVIYVDPHRYMGLTMPCKYDIARIVGRLNSTGGKSQELSSLLLGPGRWGTNAPELGVPVAFAEINNIAILGEIAYPEGNLMPDLSFGTHFFQDLVETGIFYVALFPDNDTSFFNEDRLFVLPNLLTEILPDAAKYKDVLSVCDINTEKAKIMSDIISQQVICFFK